VQTNQDLYCTLQEPYFTDHGLILKVPRDFLTNNVGDIMITQSGENISQSDNNYDGKLFFIRWDDSLSSFVVKRVFAPQNSPRVLQHSTFAPISIQQLTP